jgi:hypothetical protein
MNTWARRTLPVLGAVTEPSAPCDPRTSFPGTMLMPQSDVQLALPSAVTVAAPTAAIAPWGRLFQLLPQQMKGCLLPALLLPVNRRPVWQAPLIQRPNRRWRKWTPLQSTFIQIGWQWPTQPRRFQALRIAPEGCLEHRADDCDRSRGLSCGSKWRCSYSRTFPAVISLLEECSSSIQENIRPGLQTPPAPALTRHLRFHSRGHDSGRSQNADRISPVFLDHFHRIRWTTLTGIPHERLPAPCASG